MIDDDLDDLIPTERKRPYVSKAQWRILVDAFRRKPGAYTAAAKAADVDPRTAKRAWTRGWTHRRIPLPPIRDLLEQEALDARKVREAATVELAKRDAADAAQAHRDAARTRAQEGLLVQGSRTVAGHLLRQVVELSKVSLSMTEDITHQLQEEYAGKTEDGRWKVKATAKLAVVERVAKLAARSGELTEQAMNLERKFMGDPEKIVGVAALTPEQALQELAEHSAHFARLQDEGKLLEMTVTEDAPAIGNPVAALVADRLSAADAERILAEAGVPLTEDQLQASLAEHDEVVED